MAAERAQFPNDETEDFGSSSSVIVDQNSSCNESLAEIPNTNTALKLVQEHTEKIKNFIQKDYSVTDALESKREPTDIEASYKKDGEIRKDEDSSKQKNNAASCDGQNEDQNENIVSFSDLETTCDNSEDADLSLGMTEIQYSNSQESEKNDVKENSENHAESIFTGSQEDEHVSTNVETNISGRTSSVRTTKTDDVDGKISKKASFQYRPGLEGSKESILSIKVLNSKRMPKTAKQQLKVEFMDPDTVSGIGPFKPEWLQKYATARTFLLFFSIIGVLQGAYYTYLIGVLSTLEKKYAFKSKISGIIMTVDELTPLFIGVFVGYFGGRSHRPRVVAFGMFCSALCCFVSALPYFSPASSQHLMVTTNDTRLSYCDIDPADDHCVLDDRPPTLMAVGCLLIGSFLKGFGNIAYYSIGVSYMDDCAAKKNTAIYFAITYALRLLGPTLGFLMSSFFLQFYEDLTANVSFGPTDPRWIGAWWVGFLLQGVLLLIFVIPVSLFPRRLPSQRQRLMSNTANFERENIREKFVGMLKAVKRLARNPVYVWYTTGTIFGIMSGFGYYIMLPKFLENRFRISASTSSLFSGPPALIAVMISTIVGGVATWKWKPSARQVTLGITALEGFTVIVYCILMLPSCNELSMPGTSLISGELQLLNECNSNCHCTTEVFNPICGSNGIDTYFSPCHAGCASTIFENNATDCSCIYNEGEYNTASNLTSGFCEMDNCWSNLIIYVAILTGVSLFSNLLRVGHVIILLRSVHPRDKSVALGTFETFICTFAFIPYPIIYGALVDSACLIWESSCGETGNCWLYDMNKYNYLLHGVAAVFAVAATFCYGAMFYSSKRIRDLYEEEDGNETAPTAGTRKASIVSTSC